MLSNLKFKQFSLIMLIICISHDISAMTYNEQNKNNASNKTSNLHRFLGDENLKVKKIIISLAINSFIEREKSEIIRINKEIHNNELKEDYIKRYFKIKKSYYEDFFSDEDGGKYRYRMTPFKYFTSITPSDFYAQILINRLAENLVDKLEDAQFLVSYSKKQCQSDENFKEYEAKFDNWVRLNKIEILPEAELYEKSNKVLEERIKNLIKLYNIGSQESKFISIINYDLKENKEPHENKLIKLFIENKLLFKCDREKIIKNNEINLNIIKISDDGLKNSFNFEDLHSEKSDSNIDYREKFIIDLLLWFNDGQLEFKKNEEIANKNMEDLIEEEKIEKAKKEAKKEARTTKKKAKKEAQKAKKKAKEEVRRKAEEEAKEEELRKAKEEELRKAKEEERRKAEEEVRRKAEEKERRKAKEKFNKQLAEEKKKFEESKRIEKAQKKAKEEERRKAKEEERRKAEEKKKFEVKIKVVEKQKIITNSSGRVIKQARTKKNLAKKMPTIIPTLVCNNNGKDEFVFTDDLTKSKCNASFFAGSIFANIRAMIIDYNTLITTQCHDKEGKFISYIKCLEEIVERHRNYIIAAGSEDSINEHYQQLILINNEIKRFMHDRQSYISHLEFSNINNFMINMPSEGGFYDKEGNWYPNPSNH